MAAPRLRRLVAPASLPVTLAEAKSYLRTVGTHEDGTITALIQAATDLAEGFLGRALEPATWQLNLDTFPGHELRLPLGPVASVTSVAYTDRDGVEQLISGSDYELDTTEGFGGWVLPRSGFAWPTGMTTVNGVRVAFEAGLGTPPAVRQALLAMIATGYDQRGSGRMLSPGIIADLSPFRRPVVV